MGSVDLVRRARAAGVVLQLVGDRLDIRGPRSSEVLAKEVRARQEEVIDAFPLLLRMGLVTEPGQPDEEPALPMAADARNTDRHSPRDVAYAALFPVRMDAQVQTPQGNGRLLQVFLNRVMVHLNGKKGATFFVPEEVSYVAQNAGECP